jgi:predicted nucleic acid-binding protein
LIKIMGRVEAKFRSRNIRLSCSVLDASRLYRLKTPDSAIAATAMLTKTTLLTRNVDDFRQIDDLKVQEI